jgi:predicted  nucleic acid-binding Zn-ribbon protein
MFWEGKAREQQKHMDLINKEISRLEVISAQHESQVLSLAHLEEEQEYSQRESVALKSEIDSLHLELEKCDDEIEQCKQRIRYTFNHFNKIVENFKLFF